MGIPPGAGMGPGRRGRQRMMIVHPWDRNVPRVLLFIPSERKKGGPGMKKENETHEQLAMRVSANTIFGNIILSAFKLFAGIYAHSAAMVSDAAESIADIASTAMVMVGIKMAGQKADKEHPYGHERMECVAAILLSIVLFATGLGIGYIGVKKILEGSRGALEAPGALALVAAVVTLVVKEGMYWYTRAAAKRIDSSALMANAWHHRTDAFSSVGGFIGILGARLGFPIMDPLACVVICLLIFKTAVSIFLDAIGKMTDRACDDSVVAELREVVLSQEGVLSIDNLRTRLFGNRIYVEVEISADGDMTLRLSHNVAHKVHDAIETRFPRVKHCMVHVNPAGAAEEE